MAEFLAYRILEGVSTYTKVPAALKAAVAGILVEKGRSDLVDD